MPKLKLNLKKKRFFPYYKTDLKFKKDHYFIDGVPLLCKGYWSNKHPTGKVNLYSLNEKNKLYKGRVIDGKLVGEISLFDDSKLVYKGTIDNQLNRCGKGIEYYNDKNIIYEGLWEKNKKNGHGILYFKNGKVKYEGDFENDLPIKKNKIKISKVVKDMTWDTYIGSEFKKAKCFCCKDVDINFGIGGWECGHVISEKNKGETCVDNLRPICSRCNKGMGIKNMHDFKKELFGMNTCLDHCNKCNKIDHFAKDCKERLRIGYY